MAFTPFPAVLPPETITDQTEKLLPVGPDELLIADSEAGAAAKKIQIANLLLLAGGGGLESGQIAESAQKVVSADYLETNGQTFDRTIETDLYAELGERYTTYETSVSDVPRATASSLAGIFEGSMGINSAGTKLAIGGYPQTSTGQFITVYDFDGTSLTNKQIVPAPSITNVNSGALLSMNNAGDTIAIALMQETVGGNASSGAVYIYKLVATVWTLDATITPSVAGANLFFGRGIDISGDGSKVVIGSQASYCEVYVDAGGGTWNLEQKITGTTSFGRGVSINGDGTILAIGNNQGLPSDFGTVEIYKFSVTWTLDQAIHPLLTGLTTSDSIGAPGTFGLSDSGNELAIAPSFGSKLYSWYLRSNGTSFVLTKKMDTTLMDIDAAASATISGDGSTVVIGCGSSDVNGTDNGAMVLWNYSHGDTTERVLLVGDAGSGNFFGKSGAVSSNGNTIFTAAHSDDTGGTNAGKVYAFAGPARVPTLTTGVDGIIKVIKK